MNAAFESFLTHLAVRHYSVTALNMSSLIPTDLKELVKQDAGGRDLKRKLNECIKRHAKRMRENLFAPIHKDSVFHIRCRVERHLG